jgi:hypothetical protein
MLAPAPGPNHRGIQGVREIGRKVRLILKPDHGAEWDTRLSIPSKEAQREQFNSFDELAHGFGAAGEFKAQTSTEAALLCPGDFMTR